ncbi:FAD/NAD(P)-binding protein [Streptomyces sp. 8K308]|uniref:FAD/NAD(P)-binding protein n=1 Tax=Streptomyces sp. 8K308 TaxID=2530388 RepID=UPI001FB6A8ED|nr:FAD/NAD(P)-binding protein [Streptomyces sp. 8K308]
MEIGTEIGIVGAGAATVGLLDTLARANAAPGGITVFDGSPAPWRGRAYQPDMPAARVNAPPVIMSIRAGDPGHYSRWLHDRGEREIIDLAAYQDPGLGQPLVPRAVYGEYLGHTARAAIDRLRQDGWRVSVVNSRVTGFSRDAAVLHTEHGGRHRVDRAVLCVGGGRPHDHYGLDGAPGFVLEPYPLARTLAGIPASAHVAVIGSGLTAVDIVAGLVAGGHTGPISLLSRHGMLPWVQQRPVELRPRHLTPSRIAALAPELSFARLVSLMRQELAELGQDFDSFASEVTETRHTAEWLRRQLDAVDSPHLGRRLLTLAIRTAGPAAWRSLPRDERTMLLRRHFRTINGLSSPMVPLNAHLLLRLFDSGQLRTRPGLVKIEPAEGKGFRVLDTSRWTADLVINAVNPPAYATPQEAGPLVSSLLAEGAAEACGTGGLSNEPGSGRLTVAGRPDPVWHVLGNLAGDTLFIATNPPGLAAESERVARSLLAPIA